MCLCGISHEHLKRNAKLINCGYINDNIGVMDVDLLRPGTVPISPDTILWFEFLLNPSLLQKHLSKPFPDPSPTDLMIKFMTINSDQKETEPKAIDSESNDVKPNGTNKWTHRNLALKILSLKVAAYLKWDLDVLEKKLPLPIQLTLLQDLFYIASDVVVEIPTIPEFFMETTSDQLLFTLVLYHRWHLRAIICRALSNKQPKQQLLHIPGTQESTYVPPGIVDDIIRKLEAHIPSSVSALNSILQMPDIKPKVLSFDTFQMLTEDSTEIKQNWENMCLVNIDEFKCQIHYDLATFHLLREEYQEAKCHIKQAKELYSNFNPAEKLTYCKVQREFLDGCCLACEVPIEEVTPSLTQRLHASIKDQYTVSIFSSIYHMYVLLDTIYSPHTQNLQNILQILQADNVFREIPQVYRDNLELDVQGGLVNRKFVVARDLLLQIQCLNLVRKILGDNIVLGDYVTEIKAAGTKGLDILFWIFNNPSYTSLFDEAELATLQQAAISGEIELPSLLLHNDWGIPSVPYIQNARIEVFELEQKLIESYDPHVIRETLIHLDGKHRIKSLYHINGCWELPIPLQSVVMSLPRGFIQDYSYVLLAKSRELVTSKNFDSAIELLKILDKELQEHVKSGGSLVFKLSKLVSWECLLVEIWKCFQTWPVTNGCDVQSMIVRSKQCLGALQASDQLIPRQEIMEYCTVFLLNLAEWDYLTSLEKRWNYTEFAAAISNVCQDIVKYKGTRKFPRDAWDMILAAFGPARDQSQKRSSSGSNSGSSSSRDVATGIAHTLTRLREPMVLTVVISLLARLHNVLRDESSLELNTQYLSLWPAGIPNANSYNIRHIGELLFQLLTQALKYYPCNVPWLRLMGDLNFVLLYYESAMRYYLEAIMIASDLFSQPITSRSQIDDLVYRRMIKCCAHLQCYTQAAVLCQFLEEVDYSLAFKMAASDQKSCAAADAMDAYYHCIWDTTILEYLIHLHTKRGEHHRKQLAIKVIGLLELNSNNNEEIQREAANIRKAKFLRALAKQYVY
ncbi:integrator complex subunit 8 isoform X3 [Temnothorax nylanderi]|uniref:integrator complex subunit 8 isoform X3 n=1 Tax=Temnothorax nylanderi TaxID=102681 RepID=UPI003A873BF0